MSVMLDPNMPGLDQLAARLDQAEKTADIETPAAEQVKPQAERAPIAKTAGDGAQGDDQKPIPETTTDTPAAGENAESGKQKAEIPAAGTDKKIEEKPADDKPAETTGKGSKYAKAQERLEKTWEGVNRRKTELDTRDQVLAQREAAIKAQETDFARQRAEAENQYKPEDYERAAAAKIDRAKAMHERADGIEARAQSLEDDGKYTEAAKAKDEAKALRKAANKEEGNGEDLKAHAEQLRKNPPPTVQAREAQVEAQRKEWTLKAATDFPELGKKDSNLQKRVSADLNELWRTDRALASNPQIIYHVTRLAVAETAAASVPGLSKELAEARAKIKELEEATAPGGGDSPHRISREPSARTEEEEREELRDDLLTVGAIPR